MQVINLTRGQVIAGQVCLADTFWRRLRGLLGTKGLPVGSGLVIRPCNSVHTLGMTYPIDVAFVDREGRVLKTVAALPPGRTAVCLGSVWVLELPAGQLAGTGTLPGDTLALLDQN